MTYGTETKVISMDFSGGVEIYDGLEEKLADLNIGILGEFTVLAIYKDQAIVILALGSASYIQPINHYLLDNNDK